MIQLDVILIVGEEEMLRTSHLHRLVIELVNVVEL